MSDLATRPGLPDALRVLLAGYPRAGWQAHPHFDGLVRFWLDRHLAFRHLLAAMQAETAAMLDRNADPQAYAARLLRLGGHFVGDLHGHHQIEDHHYFPLLAQLDPRLSRGFDLLDSDHHALAAHLDRFVETANGVLTGWQGAALHDATAAFHATLADSARLLDRHLTDEEDLIVPVILAHGPDRLS
jgi:hemerythrin-like domain-containing protein